MTLKELQERFKLVSKRLGELAQMEARSAEEEAELDTTLAEFNELGPKLEREASVQAAATRGRELTGSRGRYAGSIATDGQPIEQNGSAIDRRSLGERFIDSDPYKDFIQGGATGARSGKLTVEMPMGRRNARGATGPDESRTLVYTGAQPGYMIPDMVVPGIFRPIDYQMTMRDVLSSGTTTSDTIYFVRELLFTNNAAETAEATSFDVTALGSGGRKPESALTFEQASAPVVTIAHWIPVTRQMLADAPQIQSYIENRLLVGLERRLNSQLINGAGGGTNMTGILSTSGIQTFDDPYYNGLAVPLQDVGTPNENFNRILHAMHTGVEYNAYAKPTFLTMNPRDLENFLSYSDANQQYFGSGPFAAVAGLRLWGLPVVEERDLAAGTVLVGDGTMAALWDREQANILIDTVNDQFVRNMLTVLAELRAALTVYRPIAFVKVTLAVV